MSQSHTPSMLQVFNDNFDRAARSLKVSVDLLEQIRTCHSMYVMQFPGPGIDMRTAAFMCGLQKVVLSYQELGIWP